MMLCLFTQNQTKQACCFPSLQNQRWSGTRQRRRLEWAVPQFRLSLLHKRGFSTVTTSTAGRTFCILLNIWTGCVDGLLGVWWRISATKLARAPLVHRVSWNWTGAFLRNPADRREHEEHEPQVKTFIAIQILKKERKIKSLYEKDGVEGGGVKRKVRGVSCSDVCLDQNSTAWSSEQVAVTGVWICVYVWMWPRVCGPLNHVTFPPLMAWNTWIQLHLRYGGNVCCTLLSFLCSVRY